jgi:transcriptional repressor NrdR
MECSICGSSSRVLESRRAEGGAAVRRRRECLSCGMRFTTYERREREPLHVIKRDGQRQRFDRTKLRAALLRAAHKRPVGADQVEAIVDRIEGEAERSGGEIPSHRVGEMSLAGLRGIDRGAYLQFAGTIIDDESLSPELARLGAVGRAGGPRNGGDSGDPEPRFRPAKRRSSGVTPEHREEGHI